MAPVGPRRGRPGVRRRTSSAIINVEAKYRAAVRPTSEYSAADVADRPARVTVIAWPGDRQAHLAWALLMRSAVQGNFAVPSVPVLRLVIVALPSAVAVFRPVRCPVRHRGESRSGSVRRSPSVRRGQVIGEGEIRHSFSLNQEAAAVKPSTPVVINEGPPFR